MPIVNTHPVTSPMNAAAGPTYREVGENTLSKDDFMKIFLAQMKMQDPMKPYDSSSMLQQMSQFTSLSATEELKKTIEGLNLSLGKSQELSAVGLVGKQVQIPSQVSPLIAGKGLSGSVIVPADATNVTITIKDKTTGAVVKTIDKGASGSGVLDFQWDGKDADGNDLPADYYSISANATINGQQTTLITAGTFTVESVTMDRNSGNVYLNLEGIDGKSYGGVLMDDILKIL